MGSSKRYFKMPYETPESLRDAYEDSSVLIIGSGESTSSLLKYKGRLKEYFDIVIGVNLTCLDFEDEMDYHVVMEGYPENMVKKMFRGKYRKDLTRILNFDNIKFFPDDIPILKARRAFFCNGAPNMKKYHHPGHPGRTEGLLDDQNRIKHANGTAKYGTVLMQAFHFACIIGGTHIYLVGSDLMFKGNSDHYYKDQIYRSPENRTKHNRPVIVDYQDSWATTTHVFYRSAKWLDSIVKNFCATNGIIVYDFSDGILEEPIELDLDTFFSEAE